MAAVDFETSTVPYVWNNVSIEGMGFVTGIMVHPVEPGLVYVRTDVGGAYRWDAKNSQWVQLLERGGQYYSVESIALDRNDANVVYAAIGRYVEDADGEVWKSVNRGKTWQPTQLRTPAGAQLGMGGNQPWRWAGERLAVDPNNGQIVYFGSRQDGLYRSQDGTSTWEPVTSFPNANITGEISFVTFGAHRFQADSPDYSTTPRSQVIYVGTLNQGVYSSNDGGANWRRLPGGPNAGQRPQQGMVTADGSLYVTFFAAADSEQAEPASGGVWKYQQQEWHNVTPTTGKNYSALAGDTQHPETVIVAEYPFSPEGLHRSIDGGNSWQLVRMRTQTVRWWPDWHLYTLTGGLAIDPQDSRRAWLTTGFGVLQTEDTTRSPSYWQTEMKNLEELVVLALSSPPVRSGASLFSGVADMDGFRHLSLTQVPCQTYDRGKFGDTTGLDFAEADPKIMVRVGSFPGDGGREDSQGRGAYSRDNGRTWEELKIPAGAANGKVAVSATLQQNHKPIIVWAPQGDLFPLRSLDGGQTWQPVTGAPNRTTLQLWFPSQAIASDRVDGNLFYLYQYNDNTQRGTLYRSIDGGATWSATTDELPSSFQHVVKAVPGRRGEVWLGVSGFPLYRSLDGGQTFTAIETVQAVSKFAFGKPAPGRQNPTVFVYATINGVQGLFRSDDATTLPGDMAEATWVQLSTDNMPQQIMTVMTADRLTYGRVYIGTSGRGIVYGEPVNPSDSESRPDIR